MPNVSNIVKSIQDIMRKDAGTYGDAQRLEQLGWMFLLKIVDDREKELELLRDRDKSPLPKHLRWTNWATDAEGITGEALLDFVNNTLLPKPCSPTAICTPSCACPTACSIPTPASAPTCCSSPRASPPPKSGAVGIRKAGGADCRNPRRAEEGTASRPDQPSRNRRMRLETFFEKFELFADAPNAVGRMRKLVLQLAGR